MGLMDKALTSGARDSRSKSWADHARGREAALGAGVREHTCASAGNPTLVTSMAMMYSTTRALMQAKEQMQTRISGKFGKSFIAAARQGGGIEHPPWGSNPRPQG